MSKFVDNGPMLNAYPDSCGGKLSDIVMTSAVVQTTWFYSI